MSDLSAALLDCLAPSDRARGGADAGSGRPPAFMIADDPALDFLNSRATPGPAPVEWIADGADLLAWLRTAGLAPAEALDHLARTSSARELDATAEGARQLREWFRDFVRDHAGAPLTSAAWGALAPLRERLAGDALHPELVEGDNDAAAPILRLARDYGRPTALLGAIAASMAEAVARLDFSRVKHCEGAGCSLWFVDTSRRGDRRWCSMAVCGNRAKAAAHRARQRSGAVEP